MREDLEHDFDIANWNLSQRCMKCGNELFPHNARMAENWAIHAWNRWRNGGDTPEVQRDRRSPQWRKALERRSRPKVIYYP